MFVVNTIYFLLFLASRVTLVAGGKLNFDQDSLTFESFVVLSVKPVYDRKDLVITHIDYQL